MRDYHQFFDMHNQQRVNALYEYVRDESKPEIEEAYQAITKRNETKYQSIWMKVSQILDLLSQIFGIIGMIVYAILFIIGGSFILASMFCIIHISIKSLADLYNIICQLGIDIYDQTLSSLLGISALQYLNGVTDYYTVVHMSNMFYILGLTVIFVVTFTIIYLLLFVKKNESQQITKQLSMEDSLHYLQVDEDDSFLYIKYRFLNKFNRRHKDYFDKYYQSYITIFNHYQEVEGTYNDLTTQQKIKIIIFTVMNSLKNVLGSLAKPVFFSTVLIIIYFQNFTYSSLFTLDIFLSALPFGDLIISLLNTSYSLLSRTFINSILINFDLEFSKLLSFFICVTFIYFVCNVLTIKLLESIRQYYRHLHYYLKINQGIYDEKKKYRKSYRYNVQFFTFLIMLLSGIFVYHLDQTYSPLALMDEKEKMEAIEYIEIRNNIKEKLDAYAFKNHLLSLKWGNTFTENYAHEDALKSFEKYNSSPYLKIYTCYKEKDAIKKVNSINTIQVKHGKKFDYGISEKGFMIRDKGVVIVMANNQSFDGLETPIKSYSIAELKGLMKELGYKVD